MKSTEMEQNGKGSLTNVEALDGPGGGRSVEDEMVAAARVVYLWHNGKQHVEIERKMRELGWKSFSRRLLYRLKRKNGSVLREAWPEEYGWSNLVTRVRPKKRSKKAAPIPDDFSPWLRKAFSEWTWGWRYQRYLYKKLALVTSGRCKRLMIFMPPRHGKSEMVTFRYTAWRLLREPGLNVIVGSYNQRLANKASRRIRRMVQEGVLKAEPRRRGEELWRSRKGGTTENTERTEGTEKNSGNQPPATAGGFDRARSVAEWETGGGGTVRAVGVGAGIAGFGAGLVVIDDPVRNRADAESETYRDKVWDWFNDDVYTRLEPDAAIILIQTRWHDDDLAGRLLREMEDGGEQWEVVKLPAIAEGSADTPVRMSVASTRTDADEMKVSLGETGLAGGTGDADKSVRAPTDPIGRNPGEALCPQRYDIRALERIRKKLGSYAFEALYQQEPVPSKGVKFKREWFRKIVDEAPKGLRWKRGYDLAVSLKTTADYTASFRCAFDRDGNLYIADGFRSRIEYPDQRRYIVERLRDERDTEHGVEAALHGKALIQDLRRDGANRIFAFKEVKVATDKLTRALAWLNLAEAGKLFLVRGAWIDAFVDEVSRFPHGKHDDQVDAVSIAVSMLAEKPRTGHGFLIT